MFPLYSVNEFSTGKSDYILPTFKCLINIDVNPDYPVFYISSARVTLNGRGRQINI